MKKKIKANKAITLIALIITIVVLIILASVAINLSLGNNGIFQRAKTAKEQYQNAQDYEESALVGYEAKIDQYSRETVTVDKEEYDQMKEDIKMLKEKINNGPEMDYANSVNISTYIGENNKYTFPENGILSFQFGASGSGAHYFDAYISDFPYVIHYYDGHWGSTKNHSVMVNKEQTVFFVISGSKPWIDAYFIPFK